MNFYDAHNHLQDDRFAGRWDEIVSAARAAGVAKMVVNGACESDWPAVLELARRFPDLVIPSFGYHPWYIGERTADWEKNLRGFLDAAENLEQFSELGGRSPSPRSDGERAGVRGRIAYITRNSSPSPLSSPPTTGERMTMKCVGEIGLDRWKPDLPYDGQEDVFIAQLRIAAERNLPVSIHCLQAWGRMVELLESQPLPARGFLLHSFGGSAEIAKRLVPLGAYFSLPGYFAHERKSKQRETFLHIPPDRLLIETDAPDQLPPPERITHPLAGADGKPLNHPANLSAIYEFAAELFGEPLAPFAARIEENFSRFFDR